MRKIIDTARALVAGDKGLPAMDESEETYHESNTSVSPAIRTDLSVSALGRPALTNGAVMDHLVCFTPKPGDGVFLPAGTVHALGGGIVVFEVQQNSDVTFRLYDWDHVDAKTGRPRALQVDQALACIDFAEGAVGLVAPVVEATPPVGRERLFHCEHFWLWRLRGQSPFTVGAAGVSRVLICIEGAGQVEHGGAIYAIEKGDVLLLPAVVGACAFRPRSAVSLLEIALPE